jgi:hypothetical protein
MEPTPADDQSPAAMLLRDAAALGQVRVLLRTCTSFMELFCDAGSLEVDGGWLTVRRPAAHLHVELRGLRGACLLEAGDDAYPHAPSLWLVGRCGSPSVILILDAAADDDREQQAAAFRRLRDRWGERVGFDDASAGAEDRVLH